VSQRLGKRVNPPKDDSRYLLDQLEESKLVEEESSVRPICFSPRGRNEPFPPKFSLPRDMPSTPVL
jgi:hypothetical protein